MGNPWGGTRSGKRKPFFAIALPATLAAAMLFACGVVAPLQAQSSVAQGSSTQSPAPGWETAAGGKQAFDVASVKQNKSGLPPNGDQPNSNMPMGNGASYPPNGGLFTATNIALSSYIAFAYKMDPNQLQIMVNQLPKWAKTERFDIQARRAGDPTKDQMRLMLQAVLADRFKLTIHTEIRQLPVFSLAVIKDGKFGPQLKPHSDDASCTTTTSPFAAVGASPDLKATLAEGFPALCDGFSQMMPSTSGRLRIGARRVSMAFIATTLPFWEEFDRPVVDSTGLSGTFDFFLEWTPEIRGPLPPGATFQPDTTGPTFLEALKEQLGLKLDSRTGPVDAFVIDHIEEPSEN